MMDHYCEIEFCAEVSVSEWFTKIKVYVFGGNAHYYINIMFEM